jgi:anthranilate phosphoribosyltransferase
MEFAELIEPLLGGERLDPERAARLMVFLTSGGATEAQIGGALLLLRARGTDGATLAAFVTALRKQSVQVHSRLQDLVDTCGTGGGSPSFNLSTGAAILAAAAGARVAKHGNRAVTSRCGSADVLEALGVPLQTEPEALAEALDRIGLAFLFAPAHHPSLKHVGKVRRELGVRTVFNQLGPLLNPAGARRHLIGVYAPDLVRPMAEALHALGSERALIVHGRDGLDEISPCTSTAFARLWDGTVEEGELTLEEFGLEPLDSAVLDPADSAEGNAAILIEALGRPDSDRSRALLPNAAAALWLAGSASDLREGVLLAKDAVASGAARAKLDELIGMAAGR